MYCSPRGNDIPKWSVWGFRRACNYFDWDGMGESLETYWEIIGELLENDWGTIGEFFGKYLKIVGTSLENHYAIIKTSLQILEHF